MGASSAPSSPRSKRDSCLCWCLLSLLLLLPVKLSSGQFSVVGPHRPILAKWGEDAELPCQLYPKTNAEHMEIRWYRSNDSRLVHLYPEGKDQESEQMPEFQGRTTLIRDAIAEGRVALRIHRVRVSDQGSYTCRFQSSIIEEAVLELGVIREGSVPVMHVEGLGTEGIQVVCRSEGWYPEPQIQWRDSTGEILSTVSEPVMSQDVDGLYQVTVALPLRKSTNKTMSCCIQNPLLGAKKESNIYIKGFHLPQNDSGWWGLAVSGTLNVICLLIITGIVWNSFRRKGSVTLDPDTVNLNLGVSTEQRRGPCGCRAGCAPQRGDIPVF